MLTNIGERNAINNKLRKTQLDMYKNYAHHIQGYNQPKLQDARLQNDLIPEAPLGSRTDYDNGFIRTNKNPIVEVSDEPIVSKPNMAKEEQKTIVGGMKDLISEYKGGALGGENLKINIPVKKAPAPKKLYNVNQNQIDNAHENAEMVKAQQARYNLQATKRRTKGKKNNYNPKSMVDVNPMRGGNVMTANQSVTDKQRKLILDNNIYGAGAVAGGMVAGKKRGRPPGSKNKGCGMVAGSQNINHDYYDDDPRKDLVGGNYKIGSKKVGKGAFGDSGEMAGELAGTEYGPAGEILGSVLGKTVGDALDSVTSAIGLGKSKKSGKGAVAGGAVAGGAVAGSKGVKIPRRNLKPPSFQHSSDLMGASKKQTYQEVIASVRKDKGMSLKDAMKHVKQNNLYKK